MTRARVLGARTWGALGNYLAADRYASVLRTRLGWDVGLEPAEQHLPWVAQAGGRMAAIADAATSPDGLTAAYLALARELAAQVPPGAEVGAAPLAVDVGALAADLRVDPPDVLVATKGVVARLAAAALREAGLDVPVVSHVTNPGLLTLPMHLARHADLVTVPFAADARLLVGTHGFDPRRVRVVGPLVAGSAVAAALAGPGGGHDAEPGRTTQEAPREQLRPLVLVLCNRGGGAYVDLVARLARTGADVDLTFVSPRRPDVAEAARTAAGVPHWRFEAALPQSEYLDQVQRAARTPGSFLVTKAGPNTVLEAAMLGIPVLVAPSGLPMERWVPGLVEREGLGRAVPDARALADVAERWLTDPAPTHAARARAAAFARAHLDQDRIEAAVAAAVAPLLQEVHAR